MEDFLEMPFRHKKSKGSSTHPTPADIPGTTVFSSVISGSSVRTDNGISSCTLVVPDFVPGGPPPDPQSLAIPVPGKNVAFQQAIQECIDNLSDDDKRAFQSATNVIEKLGELQQDKSTIPGSHTSRMQKVQKVLQCVNQFLVSVAICIQHHPEISSLVVGGLNCILTVSTYYFVLIGIFNLILLGSLRYGTLSSLRALPT